MAPLLWRSSSKIKNGSIADLVIESHCLEDQSEVARLDLEKTITILKKGAELLAPMSLDYCDSTTGLIEIAGESNLRFAPIQIDEDLTLVLHAGKDARLNECPCTLPNLKQEARSVNHAYTLLSRHFETGRRSSGGNVFLRILFDDDGTWRPLKDLRARHEAAFEVELAQRHGRLMP